MSSEDERTTATMTAEEETEQAEGAWFFNLSDDARRREADLTRDLRRALVDEYRQQDSAKPRRKRLFGILPVGAGDAASSADAVPAFLPKPQAQREDSSGPVPHRPSLRLAGRAGRRQEDPVEEAVPQEPAWTPRFLREDADQPVDMPPSAPLRQPPSELEPDLDIDVEQETSDWFDEPQAAIPDVPARPRELRRNAALYAGEDNWTTALVPSTLAALGAGPLPAAAPRAPMTEESTPVAEAFMRLAADEERELDARPSTPAAGRRKNAGAPATAASPGAPAEDDWHTEPLAVLASWDASGPVARAARAPEPMTEMEPAPDASLASWFDEAFQEDEQEPAPPVNRFARETPAAEQPAPMPMQRTAPKAIARAEDDWTTELTLAIAASVQAFEPAAMAEPDPEPFGINLRRKTPPAEPATGAKSRWDEMIESSKGNTGSIVDAMREVWADSAADEPAPRRKRSLRGPRPEPEQRVATEAIEEPAAATAPDVPVARPDEPTRLVGKLGGIIRRRRHDDGADSESESIEAAIETPPADSEAEIPATLWKELFGDPESAGDTREPLPFPSAIEHRQGVHTFADPVPAEELPVDEDISLAEIFGEASPASPAQSAGQAGMESDDLLPPAPVWVDDDVEDLSSPEASVIPEAEPVEMSTAELTQAEMPEEPGQVDAASDAWTSEPLLAIPGTADADLPGPPMADEAEQPLATSQPDPAGTDPFAAAIADLATDAAEAIDWGDMAGGELPYDIGWPEPAGDATHIDQAPAALAEMEIKPGDADSAAFMAVQEEPMSPVAEAPEAEMPAAWQPEQSEPEALDAAALTQEPGQPKALAELVDIVGDAEAVEDGVPEPVHDALRPGVPYGGFKPIQAAPHEADDDSWEAFFGVEETAPEDETAGQSST